MLKKKFFFFLGFYFLKEKRHFIIIFAQLLKKTCRIIVTLWWNKIMKSHSTKKFQFNSLHKSIHNIYKPIEKYIVKLFLLIHPFIHLKSSFTLNFVSCSCFIILCTYLLPHLYCCSNNKNNGKYENFVYIFKVIKLGIQNCILTLLIMLNQKGFW